MRAACDWGRQGSWDQRQVARMMADVAQCMTPSFVISTGDNFYDRECSTHKQTNKQTTEIQRLLLLKLLLGLLRRTESDLLSCVLSMQCSAQVADS